MQGRKYFTQGQAIKFIEKVFGDGKLSNQGLNISVICPICKKHKNVYYSKQKLAIRTDNFLSHCWVCGYRSRDISDLLKKYFKNYLSEFNEDFKLAEELRANDDLEETYEEIELPKLFEYLVFAKSSDAVAQKMIDYLMSRKCAGDDLWYWKFGYTKYYSRNFEKNYKNRIIMPSYDFDGNLNYFVARSIRSDQKPKYKNPRANKVNIIFNALKIDWSRALTLVEGPFDLIKCNDNATAVLGSELNANYELFYKIICNKTPIVLAFDPEPMAQKKQFKIAKTLHGFNVDVRIIEFPDNSRDVGDMEKSEFIGLLDNAKIYSDEYSLRRKIATII